MLAKFCRGLALGTVLSCSLSVNSLAQQPPSTRYQPVGFNFTDESARQQSPPSVHIPRPDVQHLNGRNGENTTPTNARGNPAAHFGASHQFSDDQFPNDRAMIRQTSFSQETGKTQEPTVPEILQRQRPVAQPSPTQHHSTTSRAGTHSVPPTRPEGLGAPSSPEQFASQMGQLRQTPPVGKQDSRLEQMKRDIETLQQDRLARQQATSAATSSTSNPVQPATNPTRPKSGFSTAIPERIDTVAKRAQQIPAINPNLAQPFVGGETAHTATSENKTGDSAMQPSATQVQPQESVQDFLPNNRHQLEGNARDKRIQLASMQELGKTGANDTASTQSLMNDGHPRSESALRLSAPSISVESYGPKSIGVNKPAIYKVVATNETSLPAERVVVFVDLPKWVEIEKVNMTAGERQMVEEQKQARLAWKIDQIPGNGSQTLTLSAIPRKAEPFDLGIEWTIAPRAGTANIQVTQPKLEMSIVGPEEVHFGDTAPYEVTVRNSGNGNAENVFVMLSEALGGQRAPLGDVVAGSSKVFTVNLDARTPGEVELVVTAVADNQAESSATRKLIIRRANLGISITGPALRYAGTSGEYIIKLSNTGDATAEDVVAALGLPSGVKFLGGIEAFKLIEGGLRWQIGRLEPGQTREYKVSCQLSASGDVQLEVGSQAKGALQAAHACVTKVQTIADLVMQVNDPPGPLTTGEEITYEIVVENRGTRTAKGVDVFMILSEGMEPKSGSGLEYRIPRDGALQFATIPQLDPGQKISLKVNAIAFKPGTHVFRAHLVCEEADAREIKEGTSRFFGDEVNDPMGNTAENPNFNNSDFQKNFK